MYRRSFLIGAAVATAAVLIGFSGPSAWGAPPDLEEVIRGLQAAYEQTTDLKASFVQEIDLASVNRNEREEGTVYYKPPRRMLWDYTKPAVKKLIINPDKAYLYVPRDRAVYVQDTARIFKSQLLVRLLDGLGKVTEDFQLAFADPGAPTDKDGNYLLVMTPKQADLGVDKILATLSRQDFTIVQCRFADAFGNRTTVRFRNIQRNTKLPDKLFQFKAPPKVEVYPLS
ncbi:MAG: outer membrane lipoprotein carrier protein LolA [Pseudomonadota bacterium]|nr:outer membrane lipoprotein carrier protein LolA [Pseudomonadota bacterium]